ncbi:hypothetical protein [Streptomyces sp. NPDC053560]|uniref:hypothetical protein n=1 Tax=Streptomyces sp. NPDC053560 TaxID=3365711 RepID=UPI0037D4BE8B
MTKVCQRMRAGQIALSAGIVALLATSCASGDGGHSASHSPTAGSSTTHEEEKLDEDDDPNLLRGFRSWLKSNTSEHDDELAGHVLSLRLRYESDSRAGTADVLTDYGPWGSAEKEVGPLAEAFQEWWDDDASAGIAIFRSQGGKKVKEATLYDGNSPVNLLTDFQTWTTEHTEMGRSRADHITSLSIGYGRRASGALTISTDYLTRQEPRTKEYIDALARDFAVWWDGDEGADHVSVTSEDQGVHSERRLTADQ